MAHRLQHLQRKRPDQSSGNQQSSEAWVGKTQEQTGLKNSRTKRMPRPIFPSVNKPYVYERMGYHQKEPSFPHPQSLYRTRQACEAAPQILRLTCPALFAQPKRINFPLAAWVTPLGSNQVEKIDVVSPVRCSRCKAYANPYFQFDHAKRNAVCNLCGIKFPIHENQQASLLHANIFTDCVVDYRVTHQMYFKKRTNALKLIIALELSMIMIEQGIFQNVLESLQSVIEHHTFEKEIRIGIVLFNDQGVIFIKQCAGNKQNDFVEYVVNNNRSGMFCCPLSDSEFMVDPNQEKERIYKMIARIRQKGEKMWKLGKSPNIANYVHALKCIKDGFNTETGKVLLFSLLDPKSQGGCSVRSRTEEEAKMPLKPITSDFKQLGKCFLEARIGVEHFIFTVDNLLTHELASTHFVSSLTGGKIHHYTGFTPENHSQHLYYSIFQCLTKKEVFDIDLTCRLSTGLNVLNYGLPASQREARDVSLSVMDSTFSLMVEFDQQQKLEEKNGAYMQFAMMYTTGEGDRLIRVINYKFEITTILELVYSSLDDLSFANLLARNYSLKLFQNDPVKVREQFIMYLASILHDYRTKCPTMDQSRYSDLFVPKSVEVSLAYLYTIFNSKLFLNSNKASSDSRISDILQINSVSFYFFAARYYCKLYSLSMDIYDNEPYPGDFIEEENAQGEANIAILPPNLPLTKSSISEQGVYLYCTPDYNLLLVQPAASADLLNDLFQTEDWATIEANGLPKLETSHNIRVNNIISEVRRRTTNAGGLNAPIQVKTPLKKGPFNQIMSIILKEDAVECNYHNFLDSVHRCVQAISK